MKKLLLIVSVLVMGLTVFGGKPAWAGKKGGGQVQRNNRKG